VRVALIGTLCSSNHISCLLAPRVNYYTVFSFGVRLPMFRLSLTALETAADAGVTIAPPVLSWTDAGHLGRCPFVSHTPITDRPR